MTCGTFAVPATGTPLASEVFPVPRGSFWYYPYWGAEPCLLSERPPFEPVTRLTSPWVWEEPKDLEPNPLLTREAATRTVQAALDAHIAAMKVAKP